MYKIQKAISFIFNPKLTVALLIVYITLIKNRDIIGFLVCIIFTLVSLIIVNKVDKQFDYENNWEFKDENVRANRYLTYILTISVFVILLLLSNVRGYIGENLFLITSIISTIVLFAITYFFKYKFSAHIFYTGLIVLYFFSGIEKYILFTILLFFVGYSRIYLRRHSLNQILISSLIVYICYFLLELIH